MLYQDIGDIRILREIFEEFNFKASKEYPELNDYEFDVLQVVFI